MLVLRDMKEFDIEDYVRWFTTETEWGNWDSPWEGHFEGTEEEERKSWTEYYESVKNLPEEVVRWKYEIECDGAKVICCRLLSSLNTESCENFDMPVRKTKRRYCACAFSGEKRLRTRLRM